MNKITPSDLSAFKRILRQADKIAKSGKIRVSFKGLTAIVEATDGFLYFKKIVELKENPKINGAIFLDMNKGKEAEKAGRDASKVAALQNKLAGIKTKRQKETSFDAAPYLTTCDDFPDTKRLKKPKNYFEADTKKMAEAVNLMSVADAAELKLNGNKAVMSNSVNGLIKHKYRLPVRNHSRRYGRIIFDTKRLKFVLANIGKEIVGIHYGYPVLEIDGNFLACIAKPTGS